jgi:two-component system sensor histidine kinase EvgS
MIQHLISQLISSCQDDARELAEVGSRGDRQAIRDVAHKIKGAARIISASEVIESCDKLEHACEGVEADEEVAGQAQALARAMAVLEKELMKHRQPWRSERL